MIYGLDTTFLIEAEVLEHPGNSAARGFLSDLLDDGHTLALAPQVLSEFVHIVTDSRRFTRPLEVTRALSHAQQWWNSKEVVQTFPTQESAKLFMEWMVLHKLYPRT